MQPEQMRIFEDNDDPFEPTGEEQWYVQAASFKTETRAQNLADRIKAKNIADQVHIIQSSNGWYAVRLSPQNEHGTAKQQYRQLRRMFYLKPIIRKVN
jgi:cell division protein FtsN